MAKRTGHVADGGSRHHGAEGANLRDFVVSVFASRVRNHFIATVVGEVHVDIGSLWTLWIQEALEGKFVRERVHVGDADDVRHE